MSISKLTNFLTSILMLVILCTTQAYAGSQWNGQEKMAGYINAGGYSIPLIKIQWSAYNFNQGSPFVYQYGKPLSQREQQNINHIQLTSSQAQRMAIYQIGDMLFLLPKGFQVVEASIGMDGTTNITMKRATNSPGAMEYSFYNGETAQMMAKKWLPWLSHSHSQYMQATPLDHRKVSAFRYLSSGYYFNGVAYYQQKNEFFQIMTIAGPHIPHAEKTQMLNFFLSNYVYHKHH